MLINVNANTPGTSPVQNHRLPAQLAQFGTDELILIELQGALEVDGSKEGQLVGKMRVDSATKKPTLMIGHHLLEGKLVNLAKPLAVMRCNDLSRFGDSDDAFMDVDEADSGERSQPKVKSWDVIAVVKRKMVFSKRPMPIIGRTSSAVPLSRVGTKS